MSAPRIPMELYREIISYVPQNDLVTLSITSRALSYEAEHILYRTIRPLTKRQSTWMQSMQPTRLSATAFLERERIHHHLRELTCYVENPQVAEQLQMILRSVANLKVLTLLVSGEYRCLPESPPFQLHTMTTYHSPDSHLRLFLQSQQQLTTFIWNPSLDLGFNPLSAEVLPKLKYLHCPYQWFISLQTRPIRGLSLEDFDLETLIQHVHPMPTVISLKIFLSDSLDTKELAELFPNVRYLECRDKCPADIKWFEHLETIRVPGGENPAERASQLLASHEHLSTVETWRGVFRWGNRPTLGYTRGVDHPSHITTRDEWRRWTLI